MWGIIVLLLGGLYGFMTPGRENKARLFVNGVLIGVVVAVVLALLGNWSGSAALGIASGFFGIILDAVVLSLLFIIGAFIGDFFDSRRGARTRS